MDAPFVKKVKYIAGAGVEFSKPLTSGLREFRKDVEYTITNDKDFIRLMRSKDFVEVVVPVKEVEVVKDPVVEKPVEKASEIDNNKKVQDSKN